MGGAPVPGQPGPIGIAVRNLRKSFGAKVAVHDLNLDIPKGAFFGLIGPNGAGKSTTLSMATGLLAPDFGSVWIADRDVWADRVAVKRVIGVLPEDLRLFERLSGAQLLGYLGRIRRLDKNQVNSRSQELLDVLGLAEAANTMIADYSQGMRKKIGLAAALLHRPEVLFLDEPFESVDPVSARMIRSVLERFTESGATIVFSSHVMSTVEDLCDHVGVMDHGHLVLSGTIEQVCQGRRMDDVFIEFIGAPDLHKDSLAWLRHSPA